MSESVIADFVAKFASDKTRGEQPEKGRAVLSEKRLVLALPEQKVTIPLSSIFDIAVGHVPEGLGDFFDSTVTIAYSIDDGRHVAAVEADDDTIDKFSTVLFKAILNGTEVVIKHPSKVGGRVTDSDYVPAELYLHPQAVEFRGTQSLTLELSTVTYFERQSKAVDGSEQPVLSIRHMQESQSMTSLVATDTHRTMSILGRYVRLEYSDIVAGLEDVELSEDETELLVAIYSTGGNVSLANVVDIEASQVTMLLNSLQEDELIVEDEEGTELTAKGRILVSDRLEDVNM